jgi:hypothetical protein
MDQDIIFQLGSLLGKAIPLAMLFVAVAAGWVMIFDAIRIYRNRETKVSNSPARSPESAVGTPVEPSVPGSYRGQARQARAPYAYSQSRKSRV